MATPQWGNSLLTTPKDEDPIERRDCHLNGVEFMNMVDNGLKDEGLCNGQLEVIVTVVS